MATLRTDYRDDELDASMNGKRQYSVTDNANNTKSFTDETLYTQVGTNFGASDINATNAQVNTNTGAISTLNDNLPNKLNKDWIKIGDTMISSWTTVDFDESNYSELLLVSARDNSGTLLSAGADLYPISLYKAGYTLYGITSDKSCGSIERVSATQLKLQHNDSSTYLNKLIVYAR